MGAWSPGLGNTGITTLRDQSGFANNGTTVGTMTGADWVPSDGRYALDFDGGDDYLDCGSFTAIRSISIWFRLNSVEAGATRLFDWRQTNGFTIFQISSGDITAQYDGTTIATSSVTAGVWNHWCFTHESGLAQVHLYKNGVHVGNAPRALVDTAGDFVIGVRGAKDAQFMDGMFDDCFIYDREIITSEAQQLYQFGRGGIFELDPSFSFASPISGNVVPVLDEGMLMGGLQALSGGLE